MEQILQEILEQLKGHTKRFDAIDSRLDSIEGRLEKVEDRLENVENNLHNLEETVYNNATEFRSHFKQIETKLDHHEDTFHVISNQLQGHQIDITHLSEKSGVLETDINQLKKRIHP